MKRRPLWRRERLLGAQLAEEEATWAEGALLESARYGRKEVNAEDYEGQSEASIEPMRESPGALPGPPRALQQGVLGLRLSCGMGDRADQSVKTRLRVHTGRQPLKRQPNDIEFSGERSESAATRG